MKKLVYVTGAGRGIGRAIALKLAEEGYSVTGCARSPSELEETKRLTYGQMRTATVDVTQFNQVENWMRGECQMTGATPWGLICAAGVYGPIGDFLSNSLDKWKESIEINLYGTAISVKIFSQLLIERTLPGRIVLLSGGGATKPLPNFSSYCAAKAAVVRWGETVALELRPFNITMNSLAPGAINTRLTEELLQAGVAAAGKEMYESALKQKESGGQSPEKAANLCAYLLGDSGSSITGRLISAIWDPWENLHHNEDFIKNPDLLTLRRVTL